MKTVSLIAFLLAGNAMAMNTYDGSNYTCEELKQIVKEEKEVLLMSADGLWGGRFVAHKKYCTGSNEKTFENAYLSSSDEDFCNPGLYCRVKFPGE